MTVTDFLPMLKTPLHPNACLPSLNIKTVSSNHHVISSQQGQSKYFSLQLEVTKIKGVLAVANIL